MQASWFPNGLWQRNFRSCRTVSTGTRVKGMLKPSSKTMELPKIVTEMIMFSITGIKSSYDTEVGKLTK